MKEPPKRKEEEAAEFKPAPADEREVAALRGEVERLRALLLEKAAAHRHDVASLTAQLERTLTADVLRRGCSKSTFETAVYFDDPAAVRGDAGLPRPASRRCTPTWCSRSMGRRSAARLMEARAQAEGLPKAVQLERAGAKTPKEAKERASTSPTSTRRGSRAASRRRASARRCARARRRTSSSTCAGRLQPEGSAQGRNHAAGVEHDGPGVAVARTRPPPGTSSSTRSRRGTRWRRRTRTASATECMERGASRASRRRATRARRSPTRARR